MAASPRALVAAAAVALLATVGCTPPADRAGEEAMQASDRVDLTVYQRSGSGQKAFLVPVVREVDVNDAQPRTALELMVEGPHAGDPDGLRPPLPPQTRVLEFAVADGTAHVDLSRDVIDRAGRSGKRPEHEMLALAAIANTLTEFPEINGVALTVEGEAGGPFWGGWGLPEVLLRDESVLEPDMVALDAPRLDDFSDGRQNVGGRRRGGAVVSKVRVRPRATYLRVTVELAAPDGADLAGAIPQAKARRVRRGVELAVAAPSGGDLETQSAADADPLLTDVRIGVRDAPPAVTVTVVGDEPRDFALHTLSDPARVVLDIRR